MKLFQKAINPPEGGWTQESYLEVARELMLSMHNASSRFRARMLSPVLKEVNGVFERQLRNVIRFALNGNRQSGNRDVKAEVATQVKPETVQTEDSTLGDAFLWAAAIAAAFSIPDPETQLRLRPSIEATVLRGYNTSARHLGTSEISGLTPTLRRGVNEIAINLSRIDSHSQELMERIIQRSISEGLNISETANALSQEFPKYSSYRKVNVARTELNNAYNAGVKEAIASSGNVTHVSVIGCRAREVNSPRYAGVSTCNISFVPIHDMQLLTFHPNHTGSIVPSAFRNADGTQPQVPSTF